MKIKRVGEQGGGKRRKVEEEEDGVDGDEEIEKCADAFMRIVWYFV